MYTQTKVMSKAMYTALSSYRKAICPLHSVCKHNVNVISCFSLLSTRQHHKDLLQHTRSMCTKSQLELAQEKQQMYKQKKQARKEARLLKQKLKEKEWKPNIKVITYNTITPPGQKKGVVHKSLHFLFHLYFSVLFKLLE